MKKTALTQLIEQLESMKPQSQIVDFIIDQATELLETEREDIQRAYYDGGDDVCPNGKSGAIMAEQYYKDTYG